MAQLYPLPTQRYAGRFLIELDPIADWSGVPGVILAADGSAWLDYARLPIGGGATENRVISYEISDGADIPVRTLRATLHMSTDAGSISPGAVNSPFNTLSGSYSPAVFGGRRVIVQDPLGDPMSMDPADWRPRFWGRLDDPRASQSGDLQLFGRDLSALLMVPYTGETVWIGEEGLLVPLDEAIQRVLDAAFGEAEWRLSSPGGDLEWAIPAFEFGPVDDVLEVVREMAQQRGAVVRWWPHDGTARFQLSLFVLQVDKPAPEYTYSASQTEDIPAHGSDISTYRNDFTFEYVDASGELQTIRRPVTEAEKRSFGIQPLRITKGSTSHINTAAEATVMLDSIEAALRVPATVATRIIPRNPNVEVNTLLRFGADPRVSQEPVDLYVVSWTERVVMSGADLQETTTVEMRGAPVGQIGAWLRSIEGAPVAEDPIFLPYLSALRQTVSGDPRYVDLAVRVDDPLARPGTLRAWLNYGSPDDANPSGDPDGTLSIGSHPADVGPTSTWQLTGGGTGQLFGGVRTHPGRGKAIFLEFAAADVTTGVVRFTLSPTSNVIGPDGGLSDGVVDSEDIFANGYSPVRTVGSQAELDALPASSQVAVLNGKLYRRGSDGEWTAAVETVDLVGEIVANTVAEGSITTAHFAQGIEPIHIETGPELPTELITEIVYWQGKLYRWNDVDSNYEEYVAATGAITIVNTENIAEAAVTAAKIAANAVTTAKLAQGAVTDQIIAAGAITAEKLLVGVGPNLIPNGDFRTGSIAGWQVVAGASSIDVVPRSETPLTQAAGTDQVLRFHRASSGSVGILSHTQPIEQPLDGIRVRPGEQYRISARYAAESGTNPGTTGIAVRVYLSNGSTTTIWDSGALPVSNAWQTVTQTVTMPAGAVKAHVYIRSQSMTGTVYWSDVRAEQVISSGLIGEGAVTAGKIGAAAVGTAQIAERAVTDALIALEAVRAEHLQDASVGVAKFASGIRPVEIVTALPTTGNFPGRVVFLTTDGKIYRYGSGGWTTEVPTSDLTGQIVAGQIAADAVGATQLADGSLTVTKFASGVRPVEVVSSLPTTGNAVGRTVFLTTDEKLYRYTAEGWTTAVPTTDLTGEIGTDLLADAAVTAAKIRSGAVNAGAFASSIRPIELVSTLPTTGNFAGRVVLLLGDGKIYRHNGSQWTAAVPTSDLTGQIGEDLIADAAITAAKIRGGAVGTAAFASGIRPIEVVSSLPTSGNVTGRTVLLTTDGKVYRWFGGQWTAAVAAVDITGQVGATQIASNAITTEKLANQAVAAAKLAEGSVTAAKIVGGAVQAGHIASGAVTTAKLDALAVTTEKLAAGAVVAGKLAAGAVEADTIAANAVTAGKLAADAVTAGTIAAGAVGANQIAAGAVQAEHIRVGSRILPLNNPSVTGTTAGWPLGVLDVTNRFGSTVTALLSETDGNLLRYSDWLDVDPTRTYEVRAALRSIQGHGGATGAGILYFGMQAENAAGTIIPVTPFNPVTRTFGSDTDNPYFWSGGLGSGAWRDMVAYIVGANADASEIRAGKNVTSHFRLPPTTRRVRLRWLNWNNGGTTRRAFLWSPTITPVDATLIHGDGIVTGSITTSKLAFEVVGSTNVVASINASTEGLRIQADKIRIDGDVQFGSGYDPTTKETPGGAQSKADAARDAAISAAASDAAAKAAAAQAAAEATAELLAEQEAEAARLAAIDAASGDASAKAAAAQSAAEATAALLAEQEAEAARLAAIAASLDKETYLTAGTTTIEGGKITTGSIAADRLAVNSAMIGMLNAGIVRAEDIQARAIGVEHLRVGSPALPLANPSITDDPTLGWTVTGGGSVSMADGIARNGSVPRVARFQSSGDSMYTSDMIEVDPTRTYEVRASVRAHQTFPGAPGARVYFGVVVYDRSGARIDAATYSVASRTWNAPVNSPYFWTDALPTGAYRDMTAYLLGYGVQESEVRQGRNVTSHVRLPASAKYVQIRFLSWGNAGTTRNLDIYSPTLTPVDTTLIHGDGIVAGSITTAKLAFTPVGSDNVVAAINASTEGIRIQANRIRIDGAVQFAAGYDPSEKETPSGAQAKAAAAEAAAIAAAEAEAEAARLAAEAYADGEISEAEQRAIDEANSLATSARNAAIAASLDKATYLTPGTTTIAGGQITTGSVTADQIAANTITAGQIASGAVTADELAANAVTAGKILAGSVGTDHLAAEAVTTAKLNALAVTAEKLAANAVTADKLSANAVTAGKVAAGAIGADEIAARVINSEHLRIGSLALPLANPSVTGSADGWPLGAVDVTNRFGSTVTALMTETDGNLQRFSEWIDVDPTQTYEVRGSLRSIQGHGGAAGNGILYFGIQAQNAAGTLLMVTPFDVATRQFSSGTTTNGYFWSGGLGSGAWRDVVGYILGESVDAADVRQGKNATSHFRLPATTRRVRLQWLNWNNGGTVRRAFLWSPTITPVDATLIHGTGIVTGSITADQIGANAITAAKILAGEIGTTHLAAGAVTTAKLEAGSVTTAILATDAVVAAKIAAGAVETEKLAANSVVASKIASGEIIARHILAGEITAEKLATGAVTTAKLNAEAVTAAKIAALAIESDKIAANAIQAGHISAGSIQSDHLVSNAVTAGKIAAGAVSADQIAALAVSAGKLAANAVTADKVAANAITAGKIATDAVTADKIAANAVTADKIDANAVTAAKIAAGSVGADHIAANAITAGKLAVGWSSGAALNSDPGTTDAGAWVNLAFSPPSLVSVTNGASGNTALANPVGETSYAFSATRIPVDHTKTYRASAWARRIANSPAGPFYLVIVLRDASGNRIDGASTGFWHYAQGATALTTSFQLFHGTFGADTANPIPTNARTMQVGVFLNPGPQAGQAMVQGVRLEEVLPSVLIKDGAITAAKVAAGAITADKINVTDLAAINASFSGNVKLFSDEANLLQAYVGADLEATLRPNRFSLIRPPPQQPITIRGVQLAHVTGAAVGVYRDGRVRFGQVNESGSLWPWTPALEVLATTPPSSGETSIILRYHNGTSERLQPVTVGAADSGGVGYRVLRVPN